MDLLFPLFAAGTALVTVLLLIANARTRPFRLRLVAFTCAAALLALGYAGFAEMLGRAKPASHEWARQTTKEATVLASHMREGEAIYLWLQFDASPEPMAYALPWNKQAAKQLHEAQRRAKAQGTRVRVSQPFETKKHNRPGPRFHAEAQPPLPLKTIARRERAVR